VVHADSLGTNREPSAMGFTIGDGFLERKWASEILHRSHSLPTGLQQHVVRRNTCVRLNHRFDLRVKKFRTGVPAITQAQKMKDPTRVESVEDEEEDINLMDTGGDGKPDLLPNSCFAQLEMLCSLSHHAHLCVPKTSCLHLVHVA
jgi:hypothetical protein